MAEKVINVISYCSNFFTTKTLEELIQNNDFFISYSCGENEKSWYTNFTLQNNITYTIFLLKQFSKKNKNVNILYISSSTNKISDINHFYYMLCYVMGGIEYCMDINHFFLPISLGEN